MGFGVLPKAGLLSIFASVLQFLLVGSLAHAYWLKDADVNTVVLRFGTE